MQSQEEPLSFGACGPKAQTQNSLSPLDPRGPGARPGWLWEWCWHCSDQKQVLKLQTNEQASELDAGGLSQLASQKPQLNAPHRPHLGGSVSWPSSLMSIPKVRDPPHTGASFCKA